MDLLLYNDLQVNLIKFHLLDAASGLLCINIEMVNSFIRAMFTSLVFSITLAASATLIELAK